MMKRTMRPKRKIVTPKKCYFCDEQKVPSYSDVATLNRYVTDRGKIIGRTRSGICAIHQRKLADAIKHARHLALMSFVQRD